MRASVPRPWNSAAVILWPWGHCRRCCLAGASNLRQCRKPAGSRSPAPDQTSTFWHIRLLHGSVLLAQDLLRQQHTQLMRGNTTLEEVRGFHRYMGDRTVQLLLLGNASLLRRFFRVINAVRAFLAQEDTVLFIGSGISLWSGLPTWRSFITQLATFLDENGIESSLVKSELAASDLLQAASYGFDTLTKQQIAAFVRNAVKLGVAKPSAIHEAIVALGPTCFVTTNYDNLLEQALRRWKPDEFYRPAIINTQLAEIAEVLAARSSHFIFKPHGDASDSGSIILTREQYRLLLPGGERQGALEALKTLLVTRPVLYLGFGLKDPDFLLLRDTLSNIYKGAVRDHYAIMADVTQSEIDYWRRNYGIRLIGYETSRSADGSPDHGALLSMLRDLSKDAVCGISAPQPIDFRSAEVTLAVTRYAAGLARLMPMDAPLEITVASLQRSATSHYDPQPYDRWTAERFLSEGPERAVLTGLPGSGKSFALRGSAAKHAQDLQQRCIDDALVEGHNVFPIFVDLKLYNGNLREQIEGNLPPGLELAAIASYFRVKLLLDAFNEIPGKFYDDGSFTDELEKLTQEFVGIRYVVSSRTADGLAALGVQQYELAQFEPDHVSSALRAHNVELGGMLSHEMLDLLRRPFFFRLVTERRVVLPSRPTPKDIYSSYLGQLAGQFDARFGAKLDLVKSLSNVAFRALSNGEEAFPLQWLADELVSKIGFSHTSSDEVINWLIARETLIPYRKGRLSFVHQSVTEYLAALELARNLELDDSWIRETASLKKWDQCLFLALGMLGQDKSHVALDYLVGADLGLALSGVRYVEHAQEERISDLLRLIVQKHNKLADTEVGFGISRLRFAAKHENLLMELVACGGSIGGEAAHAIANLKGPDIKPALLGWLWDRRDDFNFVCNGLVPALKPFMREEDVPAILNMVVDASRDFIRAHDDDECAIVYAVGDLLSELEYRKVADVILVDGSSKDVPVPLLKVLCGALEDSKCQESLQLLGDLLLENVSQATYSTYIRLRYKSSIGATSIFDKRHVEAVWQSRTADNFWSSLLQELCSLSDDLAAEVEILAKSSNILEEVALLSCLKDRSNDIFVRLEHLLRMTNADLDAQPFDIYQLGELDWTGHSELFFRLLSRRNRKLTSSMCGSGFPVTVEGLKQFSFVNILPFVDWLSTLDSDGGWWLCRQIGSIVGRYCDQGTRSSILELLDRGGIEARIAIKEFILPYLNEVSTDDLSERAISLLLADLPQPGSVDRYFHNTLGAIATEKFVTDQLIPLARGQSEDFLTNLKNVLKVAGDRHGRRYLISIT